MSAYLQMGHDTENLVGADDLGEFAGIILSPVNRDPEQIAEKMPLFREAGNYDIVLDPQLYIPRANREHLVKQPYFPATFDTADFSSPEGWTDILKRLSDFAKGLAVDAVASPVTMPRRWADEFYDTSVETSRMLSAEVGEDIRVLTTCLVSLSDLANATRAREIGTVMTRHETAGFYVVLHTEIEPRREIRDAEGLASFMYLISLLQRHAPVTVAYTSSDMLLFKAAGAENCGTSKFFNLRRFTPSRFDEPMATGGGQLPYWFEHSLLGFLREADIRRLQRDGHGNLIGQGHSGSTSGKGILDLFLTNPSQAWLAMSWRQYLSWFGKTESEVNAGGVALVRQWLTAAESNWRELDDDEILMDEPRNDGSVLGDKRFGISVDYDTVEQVASYP